MKKELERNLSPQGRKLKDDRIVIRLQITDNWRKEQKKGKNSKNSGDPIGNKIA